jgi:chromosome segregation ATPase
MTNNDVRAAFTPPFLLQLSVLAVGLILGWARLDTLATTTARDVEKLTAALAQEREKRSEADAALQSQIAALREIDARRDENMRSILDALSRIERRLDQLEGRRPQ